MQFSTAAIATLFLATMASASPSPDTVNLANANGGTTTTTFGEGADKRDLNDALTKRYNNPDCKASTSAECDNSQSLKNGCDVAYGRIGNTQYKTGGDQSGVCDGHCGIFISGSKDKNGKACAASGTDLTLGYQQIHNGGCQTCGNTAAPVGGDCRIKVDYVSSC